LYNKLFYIHFNNHIHKLIPNDRRSNYPYNYGLMPTLPKSNRPTVVYFSSDSRFSFVRQLLDERETAVGRENFSMK
ncbi:hypothetical protein, partial [Bacteroides stercoris]|uniref:hypothetical protein n=1 Tax=Bacteroides stercoris TaxID=46506 RepID=UPI001C6FE79F